MRGSRVSVIGVLLAGALVSVSCNSTTPEPTPTATPNLGGTLRIGTTGDPESVAAFAYGDPADPTQGQLLRCCLARTPLTYPGRVTTDGGTIVIPDLAESLPDLSADGRTWTLKFKAGLKYAPPYDNVAIVPADVIRAAERAVRRSPAVVDAGPLLGVVGAAAMAAGEADHITGLQAPDPRTLVIQFERPYGGFGILADVVWAPLPQAVIDDHGEEDYARFWPSSGPYMYETYPVDFAAVAPALVRNPSWDRATDERRGAWVDRIEVAYAGELDAAVAKVESGDIDFIDWYAPGELAERYRLDTTLAERLRTSSSETIFWLPMNLAVPPFDDVSVRKAANFAIERSLVMEQTIKARVRDRGPQSAGYTVGHVFPNGLTDNLVTGYDPFESSSPDLARAHDWMAASRYDTDKDGVCDAEVCRNIRMPAFDATVFVMIQQAFAELGIDVQFVNPAPDNDINNVHNHTAIEARSFAWGYSLVGTDLAALLQGGDVLTRAGQGNEPFTINASLVGAKPDDLAAWGYSVTAVPSVDDVIARCDATIGHLRASCWSELDQIVTESIVPWIPLFTFESAHISSARVLDFSLDQSLFRAYPALDQVTLRP